jgi:hypothetical protein
VSAIKAVQWFYLSIGLGRTPAFEGLSAVPSHFAPDLGGATTARPPLQQHASLKRKAPDDGFDDRTVVGSPYTADMHSFDTSRMTMHTPM